MNQKNRGSPQTEACFHCGIIGSPARTRRAELAIQEGRHVIRQALPDELSVRRRLGRGARG
jgi:hypothetical protein